MHLFQRLQTNRSRCPMVSLAGVSVLLTHDWLLEGGYVAAGYIPVTCLRWPITLCCCPPAGFSHWYLSDLSWVLGFSNPSWQIKENDYVKCVRRFQIISCVIEIQEVHPKCHLS